MCCEQNDKWKTMHDSMVVHVDENVVTEVLAKLKEHFGNITVSRGKEHNVLGTDIKIQNDGLIEM